MSSQPKYTAKTNPPKYKKGSISAKSVDAIINPDLCTVNPRPGRALKTMPLLSQSCTKNSIGTNKSKSSTGIKCPSSHYLASQEKCNDDRKTESQQGLQLEATAVCNTLAATISCVMLLATKSKNIPEEYLTFAESYLSCIKDDENMYPPNVKGILDYIRFIKRSTICKKGQIKK